MVSVAPYSPQLPGSIATLPVALEQVFVAKRIHRLPKASVTVRSQLPLVGQLLHRVPFPDGLITVDVIEHRRLEDEIASIDPRSVSFWFFKK